MHRHSLITALLLLTFASAAAQTRSYWQDVSAVESRGERFIEPARYRLLALDFDAMKAKLADAPMEFTAEAKRGTFVIELPMPDGSFEKFQVEESPVMHPDLARKHPDVKTYRGYGIDDGTATLRMDVTPLGFHAMILSAKHSAVFIDPYQRGDLEHYISYYKKDFIEAQRGKASSYWECRTNEQMEESVKKQIEELIKSGELPRTGPQLRTYRLACTATRSYTNFFGSVAAASAALAVTVNRVTGVYERDLAVRMVLIPNNDTLILTNATNPYPFTSDNPSSTMLTQNQTFIDDRIGSANYDIGHVVSTGDGGIAGLGVVCRAGNKARGATGRPQPVGDPFDIDYVAHEIGHQFGANHTQNNNCNRVASAAYEPGSASTIMGYAGICPPDLQPNSDDYFHVHSIIEMRAYIAGAGGQCPQITNTGNAQPVATVGASGFSIPIQTPFTITGSGTDADNDTLTYCWEQYDLGPAGPPSPTATQGPLFRSFQPSLSSSRTFPRQQDLLNNTTNIGETFPTVSRALNFRLTVRDRRGGVDYSTNLYTVNVVASAGPFRVTNPNTASVEWRATERRAVTWNVANTNVAPVNCQNVNIRLSTDGGVTFPILLAQNTPNDGLDSITVPFAITNAARIRVEAADNIFFDISDFNFRILRPLTDVDMSAVSIAPRVTPVVNNVPNTVVVTVRNEGLNVANNYSVTWAVDDSVLATRVITRPLASVATDTVQFPWQNPRTGLRQLRAWTSIANDTIPINDTARASVNVLVDFQDIGVTGIGQVGTIIATLPTTLTVSTRSFGTLAVPNYQVGWSVNNVPQTPIQVNRPLSNAGATDTVQITWIPTTSGLNTIRAWTILAADTVRTNDTATITRTVLPAYQDMGATQIAAQSSLLSGFPNVLVVTTRNFGTLTVPSYNVSWSLNGVTQETRTINRPLNRNQTDTARFAWANPPAGSQTVRAWTTLAADTVRSNDTTTQVFNVILSYFDGRVVSVSTLNPPREADANRVTIRVRNAGTVNFASYNASWLIDGNLQQTRTINRPLSVNQEDTVQFDWASPQPGTRILTGRIQVSGDTVATNDTLSVTVNVIPLATPIARWSTGFEETNFPPADWLTYSPPGQQSWTRSTSSAYRIFGNAVALVRAELTPTIRNDAWLVSPRTRVFGSSRLVFWAKRATLGGQFRQDTLRVRISTTGAGPLNYGAPIASILPTTDAAGQRYQLDLGSFQNQNIFIGFHYNEQGQGILILDSVSVDTASLSTPINSIAERPREYGLEQNYPNPFNPSTIIRYQLPAMSAVKLEVFDMVGRRVALLVDGEQDAGRYETLFDASALSSGIYFYRLQARSAQSSYSKVMKMLLVK
ncbi:MAG: M12 family metallo-peptidase [Chloroherpetonaceae bacterium]|nr:M12 family metallo-peptidase [Chloroherpetonaceae bacterium]